MMIQTSELKKLEEVYGQSGNQIVLLYGRDNCQKEQLIKEFCKEKKFFYYRARQACKDSKSGGNNSPISEQKIRNFYHSGC